ncbi:MAG: homoserine kinase [Pyrinomonadaceae bacterium]
MEQVRVLAPATVSNVVCGFDCLGFALEAPFDEMTVRKIPERTVRIVHRDKFGLPVDPRKNVAGLTLSAMLDAVNADFGFEAEITKHIKPGSGIGSSSASACGAAYAADKLLGNRFTKLELVEFALTGESHASGARHADNLAPSIFGGFTLVRSVDPLDVISIDFPQMFATIIHPQIEIKTSEARSVLPDSIALSDAVRQWGNLGALVAALNKEDYDLIARSLEDFIIEPIRKTRIPMFDVLKHECLTAGALGGGISGSGPSIFMLSKTRAIAENVEKAMQAVFELTDIEFNTYVSGINADGVRMA